MSWRDQRGVALMEILVAVIVISILSVVVWGSLSATADSAHAAWLQRMADEVAAALDGTPPEITLAPSTTAPTVTVPPSTAGTLPGDAQPDPTGAPHPTGSEDSFCRGRPDATCTDPGGVVLCTLTAGDGHCRDQAGEILCGISPSSAPECIPGLDPGTPGQGTDPGG